VKPSTKGRLHLDGRSLRLVNFARVARADVPPRVSLSTQARALMAKSAQHVRAMLKSQQTVYGVNTGFGRLAEVRISASDLAALQRNLIVSHAAGVGPPCEREEVRGMIVLRLNCLAKGLSGVRPQIADRLSAMLNNDILPLVPQRGSVGASGDLAPMAHIALTVIGEGDVDVGGRRMPAKRAWAAIGIDPIELHAKEGLALINGVQASTSMLALALDDLRMLIEAADQIAALTAHAIAARHDPFESVLAQARPHPGQAVSARNILAALRAAERRSPAKRVQDPYAVRCTPQVHGVCHDAVLSATRVVETEFNSATDNPLIFGEGRAISGGNFHGAPIGHAADHLAAVVADVASISERRVCLLMDPVYNGATPFLVPKGGEGLHSGLMMWQVTAASQVSELKTLAHPASVDSIPTSLGQEDHVSMSMWASIKLRRAVERWRTVLAIEAMAAWRASRLNGRLPQRGALLRAANTIGATHGSSLADRQLGHVVTALSERISELCGR